MKIKSPGIQIALDWKHKKIAHNLIDHHFDINFASQLAKSESYNKHLYRPNTYLHKWWARRCGTTFRSILKHLVRNESDSDYYAPGGLEGQVILDPMMGGGTTLHEAIRLGANVIGADIDPIPVLQARASLTEVSLKKLEDRFTGFYNALRSKLSHYYQTECPACEKSVELRFVLYGVRRKCRCQEALFVDSYVLRHNSDGSKIRICPETYDILRDERTISACRVPPGLPLYEKSRKVCTCGGKYQDDTDMPYYRRYVPVAIAGECPDHGMFFSAPRQADLDRISLADAERENADFDGDDFRIASGPKSSDLLRRGIFSYPDLFSGRQLLFLRHAIDALKTVETPIRLKLALLISTSTEFNSMLCGYKGAGERRPGAIRHTFAHHAYSFPFTALENNPLHPSRSSGTLHNLFHSRMVRGHKWAAEPVERQIRNRKTGKVPIPGEADMGEEVYDISDLRKKSHRFLLIHGSSVCLDLPDESVDHIVTDPPYFDSVQYTDLAAFFRVWLR
ncbi:hypothetical protein DENIS_4616 [Desulfonema ishimotonii]|uniref:DNA methylase N-4/N-6 domain-containing protein n=1 Tax=Desulfonema ishimotonii TaxID=45657 RepID=A0A401G2Z7_9BACT|nr:hypothetical protein [Desulfonema ishimotonii]GBC63618.1 hypothetical protein DENIS_4616 [Desulfonema ishimotonii]